nr:hypothetical protein CFP56_62084 [Quercus suber]
MIGWLFDPLSSIGQCDHDPARDPAMSPILLAAAAATRGRKNGDDHESVTGIGSRGRSSHECRSSRSSL